MCSKIAAGIVLVSSLTLLVVMRSECPDSSKPADSQPGRNFSAGTMKPDLLLRTSQFGPAFRSRHVQDWVGEFVREIRSTQIAFGFLSGHIPTELDGFRTSSEECDELAGSDNLLLLETLTEDCTISGHGRSIVIRGNVSGVLRIASPVTLVVKGDVLGFISIDDAAAIVVEGELRGEIESTHYCEIVLQRPCPAGQVRVSGGILHLDFDLSSSGPAIVGTGQVLLWREHSRDALERLVENLEDSLQVSAFTWNPSETGPVLIANRRVWIKPVPGSF